MKKRERKSLENNENLNKEKEKTTIKLILINNKSGLFYSFGKNEYYQLCLFNNKEQRNKPEQIISLNKKEIIQTSSGYEFYFIFIK